MTTKDTSRFLRQPRKRYTGVRLQQGRLLVDGDFNEGSRLHFDDRSEVLLDLLGPRTSPNQGFSIGKAWSGSTPVQAEPLPPGDPLPPATDLLLGEDTASARVVAVRAGSFYIGGRRVDLEAPEPFPFQGDFLQMRVEDLPFIPTANGTPVVFRDFFYMHSWDQCVSTIEDHEVRESALEGADTSVRVRRMRRVEVAGNLGDRQSTCRAAWDSVVGRLEAGTGRLDRQTGELLSFGRLQILFAGEDVSNDCGECIPDPGSRFLGVDNQTIRIQLTSQGFVWGFDNASPLYRVRVFGLESDSPCDIVVELLDSPEDETDWPLQNRVIEIIPFGAVLRGGPAPEDAGPHFRKVAAETGVFTRVAAPYDPDTRSFTIDREVGLEALKRLVFQWDARHPDAAALAGSTPEERHFYLRLWHDAPSREEVELPRNRDEFGPALRGTNIIPVFPADGRPGDYWTVAIRPGTPEGVVPFDLAREGGAPPHGPRHFYAPLALVEGQDDVVVNNADCRLPLRPLSDKGCVTFTVGDGVNSFGDFTSIQEAVDATPDGGRIEIRTGLYRERVVIKERQDLVIQGCGEGAVIEDPLSTSPFAGDPLGGIVDIERSIGVSLSGVSVNSVSHPAIVVRNGCDTVTLGSLAVVAGTRAGTRFVRGATSARLPMMLVQDAMNVTLRGLIVEPNARRALTVLDTDFFRASSLTMVGIADTEISPSPVMVSIDGVNELDIRDSVLSAFGQIGIEIGPSSTGVRIRGVSFVGSRARNTQGRVTQTQTAIHVNGATRVALEENSVLIEGSPSEHAGIVALGTDLVIRGNRVEGLAGCADSPQVAIGSPSPSPSPSPFSPSPRLGFGTRSPVASPIRASQAEALSVPGCVDPHVLAWGGIQIRGGSARVEVRENQIIGGIGHGITLGSIAWRSRDDVTAARIGAGRGQLQALGDGTRVPTGLIPPSFRDRARRYFYASDEGPISDLVISNNRIEQMLTNGISVLSVLGVPGGDFIDIDRAVIENNTIVNNLVRPSETVGARGEVFPGDTVPNGTGTLIPVLPFGGIVLATATGGLEIRGNTIVGNGVSSSTVPINGIFVLNGDGVSISNNRITGNGGRAVPLPPPPRPGVRAGIAVMLAGSGTIKSEEEMAVLLNSPARSMVLDSLGFDTTGASLRVTNNYVVHPEGRALHAMATGPVSIDGNSFASFGNHGSNTPGDLYGVGDVVCVQNFGPPWEDEDPSFSAPFLVSPKSPIEQYLFNFPRSTRRLFIGDGGGLLFNNNQVTFDWAVQRLASPGFRAPVGFFPVALLSLDHVGVEGNQFAFRLRGVGPGSRFSSPVLGFSEPFFAGALFVGGSVQVGGNRFSETLKSTLLSMLAIAHMMHISTYNQSTHQVLVTTARDLRKFLPKIDSPGVDALSAPGQVQLSRIADQIMFSNDNLQSGALAIRAVALSFLDLLLDTR